MEKAVLGMVILGIDPGLAIVGWGVVDYRGNQFKTLGYGSITTPKQESTEQRLSRIYDDMNVILDRYKPEAMAVEELFFNTNQTTAIRVAEARGVILLAAQRAGVPIYEYTPLQVKQAVVGYGRAEKQQVISMVMSLLNIRQKIKPDDAADALAIAVCHAHSGTSKISQYYNKR